MNKLQQWLSKRASRITQSQTTNSMYYLIDDVIIRYSDHLNNRGECGINVVKPSNECDSYIITTSKVTFAYIFNAKKTIEFINNSLAFIKISTLAIDSPNNIEEGDSVISLEGVKHGDFMIAMQKRYGHSQGITAKLFGTFKARFPKGCSFETLDKVSKWAEKHTSANQTDISDFIKTL